MYIESIFLVLYLSQLVSSNFFREKIIEGFKAEHSILKLYLLNQTLISITRKFYLKENPYIWFNLSLILYVLYLKNFEEILNHVDKVQDRIINLTSSIITIKFIKNTGEFNGTKYNYYKLSRLRI